MKRRTPPDSPLLFEDVPLTPDFKLELKARKAGHWPVAGADEAGRGPLAGPVVAAAVILDPKRIPEGLNDSKQLSAAKREELFLQILATATVSIASSSATRIDDTDIRKASLDAMRRAICGLSIPAAYVLTDGLDVPQGLDCPGQAVVKGDARSVSIAAASIVAKVTRDRMMCRLALDHPGYGFESHMGYGVPAHLEALRRLGPTEHHRRLFAPVAALMQTALV